MKKLTTLFTFTFGLHLLFAANVTVSVDENGEIQPQPAREAIGRAVSATVMIDLAAAKAEILTNVANIAVRTMEEANDLLNKRGDFAIMSFTATGVKDAVKTGESTDEGEIRIVSCSYDDRTDPDNVLATLTWQYSLGKFTEPKCLGTANIETTNVWDRIAMTSPVQVEWGTNVAYSATASIPKSMAQDEKFFLRIDAKPDAPIDDGQVFDIYSDGTDYTIRLEPSHIYEMRIISGRITNVRLIQ